MATTKRKIARKNWLSIRQRERDEKGAWTWTPSWSDFKKRYLTENPSKKKGE